MLALIAHIDEAAWQHDVRQCGVHQAGGCLVHVQSMVAWCIYVPMRRLSAKWPSCPFRSILVDRALAPLLASLFSLLVHLGAVHPNGRRVKRTRRR
jgi:hypothetical protein